MVRCDEGPMVRCDEGPPGHPPARPPGHPLPFNGHELSVDESISPETHGEMF